MLHPPPVQIVLGFLEETKQKVLHILREIFDYVNRRREIIYGKTPLK